MNLLISPVTIDDIVAFGPEHLFKGTDGLLYNIKVSYQEGDCIVIQQSTSPLGTPIDITQVKELRDLLSRILLVEDMRSTLLNSIAIQEYTE